MPLRPPPPPRDPFGDGRLETRKLNAQGISIAGAYRQPLDLHEQAQRRVLVLLVSGREGTEVSIVTRDGKIHRAIVSARQTPHWREGFYAARSQQRSRIDRRRDEKILRDRGVHPRARLGERTPATAPQAARRPEPRYSEQASPLDGMDPLAAADFGWPFDVMTETSLPAGTDAVEAWD